MPALSSLKECELVEQIKGSLSQVVRRSRDGAAFYLKRTKLVAINPAEELTRKRRDEALALLADIDHFGIARVFCAFEDAGFHHIVMEHVAYSDSLEKLILRQEHQVDPFSENQIALWGLQIAKAIAYLHEKQIIHRNIKPNSCVVSSKRRVKLAGFAFPQAYRAEDCQKAQLLGTPAYWSPEVIRESAYDFKMDSWAFGILLHQLATLHLPFDANCPMQVLVQKIIKNEPESLPERFSVTLRDLIKRLLDKEAASRPSMAEVCQDAFLITAANECFNMAFETPTSPSGHASLRPSISSGSGILTNGNVVNNVSPQVSNDLPQVSNGETSKLMKEYEKLKKDFDAMKVRADGEEKRRIQLEEENKTLKDAMDKAMVVKARSELTEIAELAKGSFSRVYSACRTSDSAEFTVKEINLATMAGKCTNEAVAKKMIDSTVKDIAILTSLQHPNIVRIFGSFREFTTQTKDYFYVVMELLDLITFEAAIKARNGKSFQEIVIQYWAKQIVSVLKYIHDRGYKHCDIKANNFFLVNNKRTVKLGHFEVVKDMHQHRRRSLADDRKLEYNAPELWRDEAYSEKSDMWSLGCLFYELASLHLPFVNSNQSTTLMNVVLTTTPKPLPSTYSTEFKSFVGKLLEKDINRRYTSKQALDDPFIKAKITKKITDQLLNE